MDKLLPCPLCGSSNVDAGEWMNSHGEIGPGCSDCGATAPSIAAWNTRHAPEGWIRAIDEALVTTHLGVADPAESYEEAKRKLGELIDWHVRVATDPMVNGGWQLVPVNANDDMIEAGRRWKHPRLKWLHILAAAPKP